MRPKAAKGFAGLRIPMLVRALGMLAIAAAVGYLLWQSTLVAPPLVQGSWKPKGPPHPLFNGFSVPPRGPKGVWTPDETDEGLVLKGKESSFWQIPLEAEGSTSLNARLRLSVMTTVEPAAIDIDFKTTEGQQDPVQVAGKIRITDKEVLVFRGDNLDSPKSGPIVFSSVSSRRLQVDRMNDVLEVRVNGELVHQWKVPPKVPITTYVRCTSGDTEFADIDIMELAAGP